METFDDAPNDFTFDNLEVADLQEDLRFGAPNDVSKMEIFDDAPYDFTYKDNLEVVDLQEDSRLDKCIISAMRIDPTKAMEDGFHMLAKYYFLRFENSGTMDVFFFRSDKNYTYVLGLSDNRKVKVYNMEDRICSLTRSLPGSCSETKIACFEKHLNRYGFSLKPVNFDAFPTALHLPMSRHR